MEVNVWFLDALAYLGDQEKNQCPFSLWAVKTLDMTHEKQMPFQALTTFKSRHGMELLCMAIGV